MSTTTGKRRHRPSRWDECTPDTATSTTSCVPSKGHWTRQKKARALTEQQQHAQEPQDATATIADLPADLMQLEILPHLSARDLLSLAATSRSHASLTAYPPLWQSQFEQRWGLHPIHMAACELAGGWQRLMKAKHTTDAAAAAAMPEPFARPCEFEITAQLHALAQQAIDTSLRTAMQRSERAVSAAGSPMSASLTPPSPPCKHQRFSQPAHPDYVPPPPSLSPPLSTASSLSFPPSPFPCLHPHSSSANSPLLPSTSSSGGGSNSSSTTPSAPPSPPATASPFIMHGLFEHTPPQEQLPPAPPACQLIFLIDGSGSVSDDEFDQMRSFVQSSAHVLCCKMQGGIPENAVSGLVGVIQFSHEARTELNLSPLGDGTVLNNALERMKRINGGTNIEAALDLANSLMSAPLHSSSGSASHQSYQPPQPSTHSLPSVPPMPIVQSVPPTLAATEATPAAPASSSTAGRCLQCEQPAPPRIVIMLTDGRVDRYQARGARAAAKRITQCLPGGEGCVLAAFGVGRGVDQTELTHIIDVPGAGEAGAQERYLDLYVQDDTGAW